MKSILLFLIIFFTSTVCFSQPSDFIILKKGDRTIKSFFAGSNITFQTQAGSYAGQITSVTKDSIFLNQYDIRQIPTNLGVYMIDTVATYRLNFSYKEITKIEHERKGFDISASGGSLFGGGVLITAVGLGTWVFTKPGTQYHASPALVLSGAALAGIGYLLLKSKGSKYFIGKKYQLEYVKVK